MAIEVRQIVNRTELEQCYDIWGSVFPEERAFFQERLDYDRSYQLETTWIAAVDGVIASAMQIFPYVARYGIAQLRVGGIGSVATLPEYRHRGLAQMILCEQISWMRSAGYDLSLLFTGIPSFYARLGWQAFRDGESYRLGSTSIREIGEDCYVIRCGALAEDLPSIVAIYDEYSEWVSFSHVRPLRFWEDSAKWSRHANPSIWIAERAGVPVGYLLAISNQEGQATIVECAYRSQAEGAAGALLKVFWNERSDKKSITLRLPSDHALAQYGEKIFEESAAMWRGFDPVRLLDRVTPELNRRWQLAGRIQFPSVGLGIGTNQMLRVRTDDAGVCIENMGSSHFVADTSCFLSSAEFLDMFLGGVELESRAANHALLAQLFPSRTPWLWGIDHF